MHGESYLSIHCHTHLIMILAVTICWQITTQEHAYESQHETVLADLDAEKSHLDMRRIRTHIEKSRLPQGFLH